MVLQAAEPGAGLAPTDAVGLSHGTLPLQQRSLERLLQAQQAGPLQCHPCTLGQTLTYLSQLGLKLWLIWDVLGQTLTHLAELGVKLWLIWDVLGETLIHLAELGCRSESWWCNFEYSSRMRSCKQQSAVLILVQ